MSRIVCCWALFLVAGLSVCGPAKIQAQAPEGKPAIKQPSLVELAKLYQELELPLPPKDAKIASVFYESFINNERENVYRLVFLLKNGTSGPNPRIWIGFHDWNQRKGTRFGNEFKLGETFEQPPTVDKVLSILKLDRLSGLSMDSFGNGPELVFAIQCHLAGHFELARYFYWRCQKAATKPFNDTLAIAAWNYWVEELADPVRDRRPIAAMLHRLYDHYEVLSSHKKGAINQWKSHDQLLQQLDLTLQPSKAKPGSVEELIDRLVDSKVPDLDPSETAPSEEGRWDRKKQIELRKKGQKDHRIVEEIQLGKLGFKAIPSLIDHVEDNRLMRVRVFLRGIGGAPFRTFASRDFQTVGMKVRKILDSYFDFKYSIIGLNYSIKKEDYIKEWSKMENKTEYDFLVETVNGEPCGFNFSQMVLDRFPDKLGDFYKLILNSKQKNDGLDKIIRAILDSNLPKAEKIDLFLLGARSRHIRFQREALQGLLELDNAIFTRTCLDLLSKLPKEIKEDDGYIPHLELVRLALCSDGPEIQIPLWELVKNLPIGAKMDFLSNPFLYFYRPSKLDAIRFIEKFLDENSIFLADPKMDEIYRIQSDPFSKIAIKDFAAFKILEILDIKPSLNDKTSPEEWEKVQVFVKNEIERRKDLEKVK